MPQILCMCAHAKSILSTLCDPKDRLLCPWDSPGKNTGLGCRALLQVIFLTQGSNLSPVSPALQADSLPLSLWGNSATDS